MAKPWAYYSEHDPIAAEWLRNLIKAGHIAPGEVDERDIRDVAPDDVRGFVQCHFFAGIGIWSAALRAAGWDDTRAIWSGSCPCQPFSAAGQRGGEDDERHLWPDWHWLISQCRPPVVVGEQVASKDGLRWLDLVSADFEGEGYAIGASDLCAAGFGVDWGSTSWKQWLQRAVRDCPDSVVGGWLRHFAEWAVASLTSEEVPATKGWVTPSTRDWKDSPGMTAQREDGGSREDQLPRQAYLTGWPTTTVCDAKGSRRHGQMINGQEGTTITDAANLSGWPTPMASLGGPRDPGERDPAGGALGTGAADRRWATPDWIFCRDGSWRPVESRTSPLVNAAPGRVGKLRAYGNCIDFETATGFVEVVIDLVNEQLGG